MNDLDIQIKNIIEEYDAQLLDPLHPVFPMPGMLNFAFGSIFSLMSFGGIYILTLFSLSINPLFIFGSAVGYSLVHTTMIILCTRGYRFPAKLIILFAIISTVINPLLLFINYNTNALIFFILFMLAFSMSSIYLLTSRKNQMLLIILAVRNKKLREMKKNGTYKQKRAEAKTKLNM